MVESKVFVGIEVAKLRNAVTVADTGREGEIRYLGEFDSDEASMRRIVKRLATKQDGMMFCYEAGSTGHGLFRLIRSMGHDCIVVAPSLIPRRPSDQVKTNRRDAVGSARLLRAGELAAVWVPDESYEAMRDLVRARSAAVETPRVHRQHITSFMLRHGRIFPRNTHWTVRYKWWLQEQRFEHPAHQIALQEMVDTLRLASERIKRIEGANEEFLPSWSLKPLVHNVTVR